MKVESLEMADELLELLKTDNQMIYDFMDFWFDFRPYNYQITFLHNCFNFNRIVGIWSRQAGKSETISNYVLAITLLDPDTTIIVAPTQSQSGELFKKIRDKVMKSPFLSGMIVKSTETELVFKNTGRIIALPSGPEGKTILGYTAKREIIEEAGVMKDTIVNRVLMPMIASKGDDGQVIKIGTPRTMNHFYTSIHNDKNYKVVKVTYKDCLACGQYTKQFIEEQKQQLLDIEFQTEYNAKFINDELAFFTVEIVEKCAKDYYLIQKL